MKILVLSDSHFALGVMQDCIKAVQPDCILHLGDMYDDGKAIAEEYPGILFYQVPGNCDMYRCPRDLPEVIMPVIGGVKFFMTHGHRHHVKSYTDLLIRDARANKAAAALYGHTHMEECHQEEDGLWVMNPGSCGYSGGTAGLIAVENGKIVSCRIINRRDLEEMK